MEGEPAFGIAAPRQLPRGTRVGPVRLQVRDLTRSIQYYEQVIGFRTLTRADRRAALAAQDSDRPLVYLEERAGARRVPRHGAYGLYHFALLLPDRAALGRFLGHVTLSGGQVGLADHAVSESAYLTDPDGLGIEVYADRPRSTWEVTGGQLFMTTVALDVRGVIETAGGATWSGLPAGTTMGHMHLHVGNLDQASAFYHAALGLDQTVWGYPGALFMAADGYHHHLGTNTWAPGPSAAADDARLLWWDLIIPGEGAARDAAARLAVVSDVDAEGPGTWIASDPWGTKVRLVSEAL